MTWRVVHDRLNATAAPRSPEPGSLPAPCASRSLALPVPPPGVLAGVAHEDAVLRRRSSYRFGPPPDLDTLAALLHLGVGRSPRAGGLPSLVPYVVARGPGPVPPGVHRADLRLPVPGLVAVRAGDPTAYVAGSLDQPPFARRVPLWVALVADLGATAHRYPARHYRTVHVDAGVALHGLALAATALGLASCPVMGYADEAWARLLALPPTSVPVVLLAVGRASS